MAFTKLKDKATIDETINEVNLVFPDQFGRLTGLKLNAEYFIDVVEKSQKENSTPYFEFKYNPFRYDILGTSINF